MVIKKESKTITEIKELIKSKKYIIGYESVSKALKNNQLVKIYLASNCKEEYEDKIKYLSDFNKIELQKIKLTNTELGRVFQKPFAISFVGSLKS
ncbi:ribosomal L7Ae/L30e/S12e/Gadd45 family protein [Candidatus Woesearchaeota archaeon]|nr:ribosomal L7Ae/L30e/S12e/Gadd45 family protein [Candidatus Woesearchaeota archaeon]